MGRRSGKLYWICIAIAHRTSNRITQFLLNLYARNAEKLIILIAIPAYEPINKVNIILIIVAGWTYGLSTGVFYVNLEFSLVNLILNSIVRSKKYFLLPSVVNNTYFIHAHSMIYLPLSNGIDGCNDAV